MNTRRSTLIAWILFGLIALTVASGLIFYLVIKPAEYQLPLQEVFYSLITLAFALVGALIISRQPRNAIGWLLLLPGLSFSILVDAYLEPTLSTSFTPPESPAPIFILILWFKQWNWLLLLFPIMFIMVLFPTGRPLSRRWGWLNYLGLGIVGFFIFGGTFAKTLSPDDVDWTVRNPIGFLEVEGGDDSVVGYVILFSLFTWVLFSAVSLFVRFFKARGVEREQIKWLFYAATFFAVGFIPALFIDNSSSFGKIWSSLGPLVMLAFPASIAIAILRYRLYDIDIIIRRTLVYGTLTVMLGLVYFGSVVLLEQAFRVITGQDSPVVIVISTLVIAALSSPLLRRVQNTVDRRFYRRKYDAQQALAAFAATARDEVELEQLTEQLLRLVQETMQPEQVSLWLRGGQEGENQ
jgi:hypothetical protein